MPSTKLCTANRWATLPGHSDDVRAAGLMCRLRNGAGDRSRNLPQMPDETHRRYLYVAIDRATPLGLLSHLPRSDGAQQHQLSQAPASSRADAHSKAPDRKRQPVHRPKPDKGKVPFWMASLRSRLLQTRHRAPPLPTSSPTDQRHGRTPQRPHPGTRRSDPLRLSRRTRCDAHAVPVNLQKLNPTARLEPSITGSSLEILAS